MLAALGPQRWSEGKTFSSKRRTRTALPKHPTGFEHRLAAPGARGRMKLYLDSASSTNVPARIGFAITSPPDSGTRVRGTTPPPRPLKSSNSAPSSSRFVPVQRTAGWLRDAPSYRQGTRLLAASPSALEVACHQDVVRPTKTSQRRQF